MALDNPVAFRGNTGSTAVSNGVMFTGPAVYLQGLIGTLFDAGPYYLLFFDATTVPTNGTLCDVCLGPLNGPTPFSIASDLRYYAKGLCFSLSTTAPTLTTVAAPTGVFMSFMYKYSY